MTPPPEAPVPPPTGWRQYWLYIGGLAPGVVVWFVLAGWLAALLVDRANWSEQADAATVREWLDEARVFRKTLPELVREYVRLREDARHAPPADRKQRLIEAAGWKGEVVLAAREEAGRAVLEVRDNGIGMTDEVRKNCLKTHFTTKRDNALFEGYSAGMGLGLSISRSLMRGQGGELRLDRSGPGGARFVLELPREPRRRAVA